MLSVSPDRIALVVETNYLIASVIEVPLVESGFRVIVATGPEDAWSHISKTKIDLAVIDFRLHYGSPDGLVSVLTRKGIPFIFCTAASPQEVLEAFPDACMILKPFSDEQLLSIVRTLVGPLDHAPGQEE